MSVGAVGRIAMLAMAASVSMSASFTGVSRAEFRQTYTLSPNGRVMVDNAYGDVRIIAWDRDEVQIQALKTSSDRKRLADAHIVVDSAQGLLTVSTQYTGADAESPATVDYRIMDAVRAYATLGEICDALRTVFGTYQETTHL